MAGRADISAGRAFVSLYVKDSSLVKGLDAAGKKLRSFGAGIAKIGGSLMALGGSVLGPLVLMTKQFSEAGSAMALVSARTGVAVEELSALGYAAQMSGLDMEGLEGAIRKMQKNGFSVSQMGAIADKLAAIENPTKRAQKAMEIFGKTGTSMLPMLAGGSKGLDDYREEAERLGFVMSTENAESAHAFHNALLTLDKSIKGVRNAIGAALAPTLTWLTSQLTTGVAAVKKFVKEHREWTLEIAGVAAGVVAAGAALVALGSTLALTGLAISGLATILGVVLSPLGLLVVGLTAGVAAFVLFTDTGQWLANSLMGDFATAFDTVKGTITGIVNALKAGEFKLAGEIAMTGLKLAFFEGTKSIRTMWIDFNKAVVAFTIEAAKSVIKTWMWASQKIAGWLAKLGYQINLLLSGQQDYLSDQERLDAITGSLTNYYDTLASGLIGTVDEIGTAIQDTLDANLSDSEAKIAALRNELGALRNQAATAVANLPATEPPGARKPGGIDMPGKDMVAASFSSSALVALGQGGGTMAKLLNTAQEHKRIQQLELKEIQRLREQGGAMSVLLLS